MTDLPISKPDIFTYHSLETLQRMSLPDLQALWELVPTERQRHYKTIYDRTLRDEGASGSDALELRMVGQLLDRYGSKGLVPVGSYWVPTPAQIQRAAVSDTELVRPDVEPEARTARPPVVFVLLALCALLVFGFLVWRMVAGRQASAVVNRTPTVTPVPLHSPTPTPLALDAQDSIIRSGDTSGSASLYPVNLRVITGGEAQPRIFIVQRKRVETTEWNYDDNPDTASYISGLVVRPVLGIPWSAANAVLFDTIGDGTRFVLQMNTGIALRFGFVSRMVVNRSDTSAFRQVGPGLVLVLIGEHAAEAKESTPNRIIVTAEYVADLELANGALAGLTLPRVDTPTPSLTPTPVQRLDVQIIAVETFPGRAILCLRVYNGRYTPASVDSQSVWLAYGYAEQPAGPRVLAELQPFVLLPGQAVDLTLTFAWHGEPFATLGVLEDYRFSIRFRQGVS